MDNIFSLVFSLIGIALVCGFFYLYGKNAWNVVLQIRENKQQPEKLATIHFVLRVAGLFVWPLGAVMGFIPIKKVEVQNAVV